LDESTRSGWDGGADQDDQTRLPSLFQTATSGASRADHVPMALPVIHRTSPRSARPRPKEPDINNLPPGICFQRGRFYKVSQRRPAPVAAGEQQATTTPEGCRDMLQDESATVNMAAMLLAVSRWNSACFPVEQWKLVNQSHQLGLLPLLTNGAKTNNHRPDARDQ